MAQGLLFLPLRSRESGAIADMLSIYVSSESPGLMSSDIKQKSKLENLIVSTSKTE